MGFLLSQLLTKRRAAQTAELLNKGAKRRVMRINKRSELLFWNFYFGNSIIHDQWHQRIINAIALDLIFLQGSIFNLLRIAFIFVQPIMQAYA